MAPEPDASPPPEDTPDGPVPPGSPAEGVLDPDAEDPPEPGEPG